MNVYITYCKDGHGGHEVDQVFLSEELAIDYVINEKFADNSYFTGMPECTKRDIAKDHVAEYLVHDS